MRALLIVLGPKPVEALLLSRQGAGRWLCARFGVSRKTAYKWIERYAVGGPAGLQDRSRKPHVSRENGSTVYGIVWRLLEADERALDRYEGVGKGLYAKTTMEVRLSDGRTLETLVYLAKDNQPGIARSGYMSGILTAAISNEFPSSSVQELRTWSTTGE